MITLTREARPSVPAGAHGVGGFQRCVVNRPLLLQSPHVVKGFSIGQRSSVETDDDGVSINLDTLQKTKPRSLIGFTWFHGTGMEVYGIEGWRPQREPSYS